MLTAAIQIILACICYSIAIWKERTKNHLAIWMIILFAIGFLLDYMGTAAMIDLVQNKDAQMGIHAFVGYFALIGMGLHLLWAITSKFWKKSAVFFHRFSIYAWGVWMTAFITGFLL